MIYIFGLYVTFSVKSISDFTGFIFSKRGHFKAVSNLARSLHECPIKRNHT